MYWISAFSRALDDEVIPRGVITGTRSGRGYPVGKFRNYRTGPKAQAIRKLEGGGETSAIKLGL